MALRVRIAWAEDAANRADPSFEAPGFRVIQMARFTGSENRAAMASKTTNPFQFLQQVRSETAKVTWPSRRETVISTLMVLVFAAVAMVFFFAADQLMAFVIEHILVIGL